jgi:uncharacterized protein YkwD
MTRLVLALSLALWLLPRATAADDPPSPEKPSLATDHDPEMVAQALLDGHNRERLKEKLPPLALDPTLGRAAQLHSSDMAAHHKMTHDGSDGSSPFDRIKRQDYLFQTAGENVAYGWRTVDAVVSGWMDSPPHKANILGKFTRVGFGFKVDDKGTPYWTADFATPWPVVDSKAGAADLIDAVNQTRDDAKKKPLRADPKLSKVALRLAETYAQAEGKDGEKAPAVDLATDLKEVDYRFAKVGVTVATGQPCAKEVLATWDKEESSRDAVLGSFADAGAGVATAKSGRPYWCLIVANPRQR